MTATFLRPRRHDTCTVLMSADPDPGIRQCRIDELAPA